MDLFSPVRRTCAKCGAVARESEGVRLDRDMIVTLAPLVFPATETREAGVGVVLPVGTWICWRHVHGRRAVVVGLAPVESYEGRKCMEAQCHGSM